MQVEGLDATIINYINDVKASYEQQINELKTNYEKQNQELKNVQNDYLVLKQNYDLLVYKRFARSAEQLLTDSKQPLLFDCAETKNEDSARIKQEEFTEVKSFKRKKRGRKPIDPKIPREEKIIDIPESEKTCACGSKLNRIGEETSEKLHIEPPRIYVEKTIRPKYACRCCEGTEDDSKKTVRIAPVEPSIIPKSIVSASLLSCIMIQKYEDHLPFYRQEKQFDRIMVTISRQDMSNWQQQAYKRLKPLFERLKEEIKKGPVMQMDETNVQVMGEVVPLGERGRDDRQKSWMWLVRGGPPEKPVVLYEYRQTRAAYNARKLLEGYSGYLQTDGHELYDSAVKGLPDIKHAGCFAHARRKFFEAAKVSSQSRTAEEGIKYIKKLYVIEGELRKRYENKEDTEEEKNNKRKMFARVRQLCAWRVLKNFRAWLAKQKDEVPPSILLGKAIGYSLSQWDKLVMYLESPYLTPDNNACENAIRPFVLGRKNWMFNKSPEGADSSCGMYSLIETAKQNGIVPIRYLTALFEKAPFAISPQDWDNLLPWNIFKS